MKLIATGGTDPSGGYCRTIFSPKNPGTTRFEMCGEDFGVASMQRAAPPRNPTILTPYAGS